MALKSLSGSASRRLRRAAAVDAASAPTRGSARALASVISKRMPLGTHGIECSHRRGAHVPVPRQSRDIGSLHLSSEEPALFGSWVCGSVFRVPRITVQQPACLPSARTDPTCHWKELTAPFRKPSVMRSVAQATTTWALFFATWAAAYRALEVSYLLVVPFVLAGAGLLVRLFIIQHDCGHGSYFQSARANAFLGRLSGYLMLTPYEAWRSDHAAHHASTGDLDRRGTGDITTWTVEEYRRATPRQRLGYRLVRNPFVMLAGGPIGVFMIGQRFPGMFKKQDSLRQRFDVHVTSVVGLSLWAVIIVVLGWKAFLVVHLPMTLLAASGGIFLFYAQHQFEGVYWRKHEDWDYVDASLQGSSYLKLNPVLRFFSGDIGVHHLHHLAPRIPNYRLRACLDANPCFQNVTELTLWDAIKTLRFALYDEERRTMVTWEELREIEARLRDDAGPFEAQPTRS